MRDPRSVLSRPDVFAAFQRLIGRSRSRGLFLRDYARPRPGERVLDIGCGPGDIVADLPDVDYVGIDPDARYIAAAGRRFGDRASFVRGAATTDAPHERNTFDVALAVGVMHHLDDAEVNDLLRLAKSALHHPGAAWRPSTPATRIGSRALHGC